MKIKVLVEFVVDEDDVSMAEAEVEAQLNDMINSNLSTVISGFQIMDTEAMETQALDDY